MQRGSLCREEAFARSPSVKRFRTWNGALKAYTKLFNGDRLRIVDGFNIKRPKLSAREREAQFWAFYA